MIKALKEHLKKHPMLEPLEDADYLQLSLIIENISMYNGHVSTIDCTLDYDLCDKARKLQWDLIQFIMYVEKSNLLERLNAND